MKKKLLFLFVLCLAKHSISQVTVRNSGSVKLFVAYCSGNLIGGWTSRGWIPVAPGEEKVLYNVTALDYPRFYYCAIIENCDQGYFGNTQLLADPRNAFSIAHADKAQNAPNTAIKPIGFREIELNGKKAFTIELNPMNILCNQQPQGKWRVDIDKEGDYAEKKEDAFFYREITFEAGKPVGWCKDYYPDGTLRAEFKLAQFKPAIYDGKCTWYNKDGNKEKELIYQNGNIVNNTCYDANGVALNSQITYMPVALPIQNFYLNSTGREALANGHSRLSYYPELPANTIKWYYEFAASRNSGDIKNLTANFSVAAKLSSVIDKTGLLALSINLFAAPPGADYCNVYVGDQQAPNKISQTASRINYRSGIVEVNEPGIRKPVMTFSNPSGLYGLSVSVQVVAIITVSK